MPRQSRIVKPLKIRSLQALAENVPRPPRGQKRLYLPNFRITLLRTPHLPPTFASFLVPLHLNKLDIKDYLWHAYNIPVTSVRSFIQYSKVRQDKPNSILPKARRWFRARSIKKMTVEMGEMEGMGGGAFVWPEEVKDFEKWDKERMEMIEKHDKERQEEYGPQGDMKPSSDRKSIAEQAKALLEGKEKWVPSWKEFGNAPR